MAITWSNALAMCCVQKYATKHNNANAAPDVSFTPSVSIQCAAQSIGYDNHSELSDHEELSEKFILTS